MTLGYLHVGRPEHGVHRYGALLAAAAREHLEAEVVETHALLAGTARDADRLRAACAELADADVCHIQYEPRVWGGLRAAANVRTVVAQCSVPFVVSVHDAREAYSTVGRMRRLWEARQQASGGAADAEGVSDGGPQDDQGRFAAWGASLRRAWRFWQTERVNEAATRHLAQTAAAVLVCTEPEAHRLQSVAANTPLAVIPHFIEKRVLPDRAAARRALGMEPSAEVVSVLGFIHRQKGHDRVVQALPHLPETTQLVCIGAPSDAEGRFVDDLRVQAEALGVAHRMRITGYVEEPVLNQYLAATDVAVCPFRGAAASGSLSTWIAAGRPLVVSDLPLFAFYREEAPAALRVVSSDSGAAWARAIAAQQQAEAAVPQLRNLQERLALSTTVRQHARWYNRVAASACL